MLINLSNHPSTLWSEPQRKAAAAYGSIHDIAFPVIDPAAKTDDIEFLAEQYEQKIRTLLATENSGAFAVHLMGEMTFCFALITRLKSIGIDCIASTTRRNVTDNADGSKTTHFEFVQFRAY